ncbi:hypothetical protein [Streptomyces antibioticus]|uniref:hypothetical protein n=1 Tax=Streptomyces antibioticus TaxID=1890 RepID=UPI0033DDF707
MESALPFTRGANTFGRTGCACPRAHGTRDRAWAPRHDITVVGREGTAHPHLDGITGVPEPPEDEVPLVLAQHAAVVLGAFLNRPGNTASFAEVFSTT